MGGFGEDVAGVDTSDAVFVVGAEGCLNFASKFLQIRCFRAFESDAAAAVLYA